MLEDDLQPIRTDAGFSTDDLAACMGHHRIADTQSLSPFDDAQDARPDRCLAHPVGKLLGTRHAGKPLHRIIGPFGLPNASAALQLALSIIHSAWDAIRPWLSRSAKSPARRSSLEAT